MSKDIKLEKLKSITEISLKARDCFKEYYDKGVRNFVTPGGNTPKRFYKMISKLNIDWSDINLILSDERLVPYDNIDSNYLMVQNYLINNLDEINQPILIPEMKYFNGDIEGFLKKTNDKIIKIKNIQIAFLGLGADGHTASLFPGHQHNSDSHSPYFYVKKLDSKTDRISLDLEFLSSLKRLMFLVSGFEKEEAVKSLIDYKNYKTPISKLIKHSEAKIQVLKDF